MILQSQKKNPSCSQPPSSASPCRKSPQHHRLQHSQTNALPSVPHFIAFTWSCRKLDVANKKLQKTKDVLQVNVDMKALQMEALHEVDHSAGMGEPVSPIMRPSDAGQVV